MTGREEILTHRVEDSEAGQRLDRILAARHTDLSRSRLKALIEEGRVSADGVTITEPSYRVKPGQSFVTTVPEATPYAPQGQAIPLDILYEDSEIIVIDKPAGLVVHPAPGNPDLTLVNALIAHCGYSLSGIGGVRRPGIVHRLDKDTSGIMVAAKTDRAHHALSRQFEKRTAERAYLAVVWGVPTPASGRIEGNIGRDPRNRKKMTVVRDDRGKPAATGFRRVRRFGTVASLVECRLETGRTHQVRVHMTHAGHPLVGDPLYGRTTRARIKGLPETVVEALRGFPRQALHARLLAFDHPESGERMRFEAEIPSDMKELCDILEYEL
jgi:23S rRNA pseudouridine1911/1915/1917 synthase